MKNKNLSNEKKTYYISIAILAGMFFIFGFVSWVNSILIPYFRISCELTHFESYFVAFAFYIAYFVMAVPSGILLKKVGFKRGIMYGFMLTALGAFIFVPAALARQFEIFLIGLFSIGTGLAILQTAANPYVTIIGPIDSAARRISIMGICNKFAGIISPLIFAALILKADDSELFALIGEQVLVPFINQCFHKWFDAVMYRNNTTLSGSGLDSTFKVPVLDVHLFSFHPQQFL